MSVLATLVHFGSREGKGVGPFRAAVVMTRTRSSAQAELVGLRSKAGKNKKAKL